MDKDTNIGFASGWFAFLIMVWVIHYNDFDPIPTWIKVVTGLSIGVVALGYYSKEAEHKKRVNEYDAFLNSLSREDRREFDDFVSEKMRNNPDFVNALEAQRILFLEEKNRQSRNSRTD
ncbi:hypothetical protein J2Y48_002485 [Mycoplana sp. BE70]|uniref:hypothetical protein n=1 Tax=Mycoplana sp. BE70 TaxID=2817775 RepID=UPI0028547BD9|nr:hypothetical protein [Mycoplana sp. BE70]MDR6757189.1 hypothetical protein [Mycoplana sp. BE70]